MSKYTINLDTNKIDVDKRVKSFDNDAESLRVQLAEIENEIVVANNMATIWQANIVMLESDKKEIESLLSKAEKAEIDGGNHETRTTI